MANNRDEFSAPTKRKLADRAGHCCSYCKQSTIGPSDEAEDAVTNVGVAAHIRAAASGSGARRYDSNMTSKQRVHITNGIWLCATCATLIDRDEERFPINELHRIKIKHEENRKINLTENQVSTNLISLGHSIVVTGGLIASSSTDVRISIDKFIVGDSRDLMTYANDFVNVKLEDHYILMAELGYGRVLNGAPSVERQLQNYNLIVPVFSRVETLFNPLEVQTLCAETMQMLSGLEALISNIESALGFAYGTWFTNLKQGTYLSDIYWSKRHDPLFQDLVKMEIIRLASIPAEKSTELFKSDRGTSIVCTSRVNDVKISSIDLEGRKLRLQVDLDFEGFGNWSGELLVFICTPEELIEGRENARTYNANMATMSKRPK